MQNRYAGDAGDYGKLSLLKALAKHLKIGVNWYLVDIPGEKTNDGKHVKYLDNPDSILFQCDPMLARKLRKIAFGKRSVQHLQKLLPDATFYSEILTPSTRALWHEKAVEVLKKCDLVFLDPDNGLLVPSVKRSAPISIKYVFEDEIARYYSEACSVLVYNHRSHERREKYSRRFIQLFDNPAFTNANKFVLTYRAYSVRDYIFIVQTEHSPVVTDSVTALLESNWKNFFNYYPLNRQPDPINPQRNRIGR